MIVRALLLLATVSLSFSTFARSTYPKGPDARLTPGTYCENPDSHRYPEKIPYCSRNVDKSTKWRVIENYNKQLGYNIEPGDRHQFKIDHLIPLCAGGSNQISNLWPQHQSVYNLTDDLEGLACEKMASGDLLQERAVELLMRAKNHLEEVDEVREILKSL